MSSKSINAREVFIQAMRFDLAAHILLKDSIRYWHAIEGAKLTLIEQGALMEVPTAKTPHTAIPSIVCEAFSAELYLKTILCIESIEWPRTHDLDKLYANIPQHWKDRITRHFEKAMPPYQEVHPDLDLPERIEDLLAQASKSFERWRYLFEGSLSGTLLAPATKSICMAIVEAKPEWAKLAREVDGPKDHHGTAKLLLQQMLHFELGD